MAVKSGIKARYVKCPRCELNYINANVQEYCDICLKEMKGKHDDFDDFNLEDEETMELCPICGENMIRAGEEMCEECRKKHESDTEAEPDPEKDDEWRSYLDEETDEGSVPEGLPPEDFTDDFDDEEEEEEEEEEHYDEEDDFEYVNAADYDFDDEDEDEEDEEDDDFDDDDFDAGLKKANKKKKRNDD